MGTRSGAAPEKPCTIGRAAPGLFPVGDFVHGVSELRQPDALPLMAGATEPEYRSTTNF
jgi:hypothetical protein